jgi:hypothetical protein
VINGIALRFSLFFSANTPTHYPSRQVVSVAIFFDGGGPIPDVVALSMSSDSVSLLWIGVSVSSRLGTFESDDHTSKVRAKNCMLGGGGGPWPNFGSICSLSLLLTSYA